MSLRLRVMGARALASQAAPPLISVDWWMARDGLFCYARICETMGQLGCEEYICFETERKREILESWAFLC